MILWLRARRIGQILTIAVATIIFVVLAGAAIIPIPRFGSVGVPVPLGLLAPLALSTVLAFGLGAGDALEAAASRPIPTLDVLLILTATVGFLGVANLFEVAGVTPLGTAAGRNACGYVGLMLIGRSLAGHEVGALVPVAFALFVAAFGGDASGQPRWWAFILAEGHEARSLELAGLAFILGVAAFFVVRRGFRSPE